MATRTYSTIALSSLIRDPRVRAAFERAERDNGSPALVTVDPKPVLTGGELVEA